MATNWQLAGMWGQSNYTDTAGNVISGSLTVYSDAGRTIPATLYTDQTKASTAANPVSADALGNFTFFAVPGVYYGIFNHAGTNSNTEHLVAPHPSDPALGSALQVAAGAGLTVDNTVIGTATVSAVVGSAAGTLAAGNDTRFGAINGIPVTGTPTSGWVPRASGSSTAAWAQLSASDVGAMAANTGYLIANNLSELAGSPATARGNLGLGGAALLSVGTTTGTVAAGDDGRFAAAAQKSANLSDLASAATARSNLSLGGAALLAVGATTGTVAAGDDSRFGKIAGVTVSGTAAAGQVPVASSSSAAAWGVVNGLGSVILSGTPSAGQVPRASAGTTAAWGSLASTDITGLGGAAVLNVGTASSTVAAGNDSRFGQIAGVTVSGTATSGQVPVASSSSAAAWGSPTTNVLSGITVSGTPSAGQVLSATSTSAASWATPTAGTAPLTSAKWAFSQNVNLASPGASPDGISTIAVNDRVLVPAQTTQSQNGVYVYNGAATPMTRSTDANSSAELNNAVIEVTNGAAAQAGGSQANSQWVQLTANPTIGTSNIVWLNFAPPIPVDGAANVPSLRSVGQVAGQVMPGDFFSALAPSGWLAQSIPRQIGVGATSVSPATTVPLLIGIYLSAGMVIGHIAVLSAGAQVTPTNWWFGLADSSEVQLATTADQTTTVWAANTVTSLAIATIASGASATFTTTYSGLHYVIVFQKAATPSTISAASSNATVIGLSPVLCAATSDAGITGPPAFPKTYGTLTAKGALAYAGVLA